ncbi:hypothetical protein RhiirA5_402549 [Rhizophagus irregularis]|uniref:BED-type domain-containing protein n=1 Tax=Rhizophagus irregularis TaxID=588596 RepID=A0A2N0RMS0_9GLOM|nr:hypothetical protein RhiirA5_402549 [Rhizophagus irregularis]PKC64612.1 hypothetical protein RhiirA1_442757 [Rhizophagus irregularis]
MTDHIEDSPIKKKNRGGQPPNSIWEDINKEEAVGSGKFATSCKYCKNTWSHDEVSKLEEHLSNHCPDAPAAVVRRFRNAPLKKCTLMRIIKCAASIRKNLGFDRYKAKTLCDQI